MYGFIGGPVIASTFEVTTSWHITNKCIIIIITITTTITITQTTAHCS